MANYSTNEFKLGIKVILDQDPYTMIESEFCKPGKGQAFTRVKLKNLKTHRVIDRTYKSGDSIEAADIAEMNLQYLYQDSDSWHFLDPKTFEQHVVPTDVMGEIGQWLIGDDLCTIVFWNDLPLSVTPPIFVTLSVQDTEPGFKGDTAQGGSKLATLETGAVVKVPLFIDIGDHLKIDTRSGEYVSRVKE